MMRCSLPLRPLDLMNPNGKTPDVDDDDLLTDSDAIEEKMDSRGQPIDIWQDERLFSQCELLLLVARIWENQL